MCLTALCTVRATHTHTHRLTANENHFPITTAWGSLYMHLPWETSMHSHRPQWDKETHIIPSFMGQYHMFSFPLWIMHIVITVQYTTLTYKLLHVSMWVEWEDLSVSCTTLANNNFTCVRVIAGQSVLLSKTCFSKWARACIEQYNKLLYSVCGPTAAVLLQSCPPLIMGGLQ